MIGYRDPRFRAIAFALRLAVAAGLIVRVVLAMASVGSHDALLWEQFGQRMNEHGLAGVYSAGDFNHPPGAGCWLLAATKIADATSLRFAFVFKWPVLLAEVLTCALLFRIGEQRGSRLTGGALAALWAWNPGAILVSGFHCNTDPIYTALAVLAIHLVQDRKRDFLGGLALAAAINVKLIPVVLILPIIGLYRDPRAVMRFIAGLSIGAVPYLIAALAAPDFVHKVLSYNPSPTFWGINAFLREMTRLPRFSGWAQPLLDLYHERGRLVMLLAIAWITIVVRRRSATDPRVDRFVASALTAALFLILAPGFGVQYTVFTGAMVLIVSARFGALWGVLTGLQLIFGYWLNVRSWWPIDATLPGKDDPAPSVLFGLLAWATLIVFVWRFLTRSNARSTATASI